MFLAGFGVALPLPLTLNIRYFQKRTKEIDPKCHCFNIIVFVLLLRKYTYTFIIVSEYAINYTKAIVSKSEDYQSICRFLNKSSKGLPIFTSCLLLTCK